MKLHTPMGPEGGREGGREASWAANMRRYRERVYLLACTAPPKWSFRQMISFSKNVQADTSLIIYKSNISINEIDTATSPLPLGLKSVKMKGIVP